MVSGARDAQAYGRRGVHLRVRDGTQAEWLASGRDELGRLAERAKRLLAGYQPLPGLHGAEATAQRTVSGRSVGDGGGQPHRGRQWADLRVLDGQACERLHELSLALLERRYRYPSRRALHLLASGLPVVTIPSGHGSHPPWSNAAWHRRRARWRWPAAAAVGISVPAGQGGPPTAGRVMLQLTGSGPSTSRTGEGVAGRRPVPGNPLGRCVDQPTS